MMAVFHPNLVSQSNDDRSSYPRDHKLASYDELPSQRSNMAIYIDQASAAGSYSEFLLGNSSSSHKCDEFLPDGDRNEMMFIPPTSDPMNLQPIDEQFHSEPSNPAGNSDSLVVSGTQLNILGSEQNFQCQGLSLSLGTEMQSVASLPSFQYQNSNLILPSLLTPNHWTLSSEGDEINQSKGFKNHDSIKAEVASNSQCFNGSKEFHTDMYMHEYSGYSNILNAKYLKAARELLDELVSIKKALKPPQSGKSIDRINETVGGASDQSAPPVTSRTNLSEVSPAERQELQNKKTKLMSMFDEVNRRYKHYYNQMQFMETSFDMVAGQGAAKTYTALALQTISRHFRCLRDAISSHIDTIRKRLGEEDNGQGSLPRLRLVDQQLRQQRALLQNGVMRHAWRPQRGLPENSVSVLRAWLFEHFLHPYPNDSEKLMLAKQTGLTRNQVANWFINARVRLWKPMVEDIYKEEFGDIEGNSKSSQDDAGKPEASLDKLHESVTSADTKITNPAAKSTLSSSSEADKVTTDSGFMNFQHDFSYYSDKKIPQDQHEEVSLLPNSLQYDISGLSGFGIGNQVTLELGLQHHESDAFALSSGNHIRVNNGIASLGPESVDFHCMDPGKQQDRFGNSHLLHDFVV